MKSPLLLVVLALTLLATSCQSAASGRASPAFRVGTLLPASLDPALASQPQEGLVAKQLFDGLVRYDDTTAAVVPDVASSWEISDGNTRFTFHLRSAPRFSNGEYVTASSFVRGMTRALTPAVYRIPGSLGYELDGLVGAAEVVSGTATTLAGARAVDDHTLEIRLSSPDAQFLIRCGDFAFMPLPSDAAMSAQRPSWAQFPIGNGPFRLAGPLVPNQTIALVPNPLHAGGHPKAARVELRIFGDLTGSYQAWKAGELDWSAFPPEKTAETRHLYRPLSLIRPTAGVEGLVVGGPDNALFRQAVSLAIDRSGIATGLLTNAVLPAVGIVPPRVPGSAAAVGPPPCPACTYDPARARRLLAESGVKVEGVFPLSFIPGVGEDAWVRAVADQLKANLGIDASPVAAAPPPGSLTALAAFSRTMRYPTPDDFLESLLGSGGHANLSGYANPAFDTLLAATRAMPDPGARASAYQEVERSILSRLPVIPLFWPRNFRLAHLKQWGGVGMDAFGDPTLRTVFAR